MNEAQITEAIARVMFSAAEWQSPNLAWVQCPGIDLHSTSNGKKDCRLTINDELPPTLFCCHESCKFEIASLFISKVLRVDESRPSWQCGDQPLIGACQSPVVSVRSLAGRVNH